MPTPITQFQIPDHSILDINGKQTYLGNTYGVSSRITLAAALTEVPFMILQNPLGNTKSLFSFTRRVSCITFSGEVNYNMYLNPILVTAGITINPVNLRPSSGNNSSMIASINPIVTGAAEVQTITTVADVAGSLNNTYFFINSSSDDYYVWFNVGGAGSNPAPGPIGIEVSVATNASSTTIAAAITTALNLLPLQFSAVSAANIVTVTNVGSGAVVPASDGGSPTGFTFNVLTPGTANFGTYITTLGASIDPVVDNILYILDAGQNLLVTASASAATLIGAVELDWFEI
jgi:hypothetical protein